MADTSDRIMKFVGAARQEKGAEASKELGGLFYDKAADKLDQFSKEIEFGTHSFAPPEGGLEDQEITDALAADAEEPTEEETEEQDGEETERDSSGSE